VRPINRKITALSIVLLLAFMLVGQISILEAEAPSMSVGDSWTYAGERLSKYYNVTIDRNEDYEGVQCYVWITNYPDSTLQEWITTKEEDWVILKLNHDIAYAGEIVDQTYSPGLKLFDFPLNVGKEWSGRSYIEVSSWWNSTEGIGESDKGSEYMDWSRKVVSKETVTVPAGTFDTYVIEEVEYMGGQIFWFSTDVKNYVKHAHCSQDTTAVTSLEHLTSCELAQTDNGASNLPLIIILPAAIGVLGVAFFIYSRRNHRRKDFW